MSATAPVKAVFWDFGGVILTSPFEAFNRYEQEAGLPRDLIRSLNARDPDRNAWARLERSEVDVETFCRLFEEEARLAGHQVSGERVLACLSGQIRPQMVAALRTVTAHYKTACLTNNVRRGDGPGMARTPEQAKAIEEVMALFDAVIESSKVGVRKPEPRFYAMACEIMRVRPEETVFLDDLGVNLKPAREMGMRTIKVGDPDRALAELEAVLDLPLR